MGLKKVQSGVGGHLLSFDDSFVKMLLLGIAEGVNSNYNTFYPAHIHRSKLKSLSGVLRVSLEALITS